ncbi:hypothetical protein ACLB2K_002254 [Fragaria x ananassa]
MYAPALKCGRPSVLHPLAPATAHLHPRRLQQRPQPLSLPGESVLFQFSGKITVKRCGQAGSGADVRTGLKVRTSVRSPPFGAGDGAPPPQETPAASPTTFPPRRVRSFPVFRQDHPKTSNKVDLAGKPEKKGLARKGKWSGTLLESSRVEARHCRRRRVENGQTIIMAASTVERERSRRLTTAVVNQVVQEALAFKSPPRTRGGKRGRIYYSTQAAIRPPTFVFFVNDAKLFPETYRRYMEKQLRSDAGFAGTPLRLLWSNRRKTERDEGRATTRPKGNLLSEIDDNHVNV